MNLSLDSIAMPKLARIAAILMVALLASAAFAGCAEDRSNLLPEDTVAEITADIDEVQDLVSQGECFSADIAAERARTRVESLGPEVDSKLKTNLLDGVTQLQVTVKDRCQEVDSTTEPLDPEQPSGTTGTTDTTTPSGTTDSGNESGGSKGGGSGSPGGGDNGGNPAPKPNPQPNPEPTNPPSPTPNPQPPPTTDPGSGGVGPGTGG